MSDPSLIQAFSKARFRATLPPQGTPPVFHIITSHNPNGQTISPTENNALDQSLVTELDASNIPHFPVTGYDAASDHAEPGHGIICDQATAIELGQKFQQVAIFTISEDEVHLIQCTPPYEDTIVAKWSERLSTNS